MLGQELNISLEKVIGVQARRINAAGFVFKQNFHHTLTSVAYAS